MVKPKEDYMNTNSNEDYSKIFNTLKWLSIAGIFFIALSIPALFGTTAEAEEVRVLQKSKIHPEINITTPDVSYAFEVKANVDNAKEVIDNVLSIKETLDSVDPDIYTKKYVGEFYITMYAATVEQCGSTSGITASGRKCTEDPTCHTVAVDPSVIPLGTYLMIEGYEGIIFRADDTGSAINGYDIDIYTDSEAESKKFNNQSNVKVWIVED